MKQGHASRLYEVPRRAFQCRVCMDKSPVPMTIRSSLPSPEMIGLPGCAAKLAASKGRMASSAPSQARWVAAWPRRLQPTCHPMSSRLWPSWVGNSSSSRKTAVQPSRCGPWFSACVLVPRLSHHQSTRLMQTTKLPRRFRTQPAAQQVRMGGFFALLYRP